MNTLKKQFSDALKREGKTITTYYKSETVNCLFRKNNDNNNTDNHMTIFYDVSAPIYQGQLLSYGGKQYITLNKESVDNDAYYKSSLLECNTRLIVGVGSIGHLVPCYSSDLISPTPSEGKIITTIDGNLELITEDNEISRNILLNNKYIFMGGTYQVINKLIKSGIYYFYMQRITNAEPVYTFSATTELSSYDVGETVQITVLPMVDGITDPSAIITYTSSNPSAATVTNKGLINCIAEGTTTITVTWVEQNKSQTIDLTVMADAPEVITVSITSDAENYETKLGIEYLFNATFTSSVNGVVTPTTPVFSLNTTYNGNVVLVDNGNATCTITVNENAYDYLTKEYILTCMDTTTGQSGSATYTITSLF